MIFDSVYCAEEIHAKRQRIAVQLQQQSRSFIDGCLVAFCKEDLATLFSLYDHVFFDHWFRMHGPIALTFHYSGRLTSSAGLTKVSHLAKIKNPIKWHYEIHISKPLLQNCKPGDPQTKVNGYIPYSQLEALQLIMEHELCHIIEFLSFGKSNCHAPAFHSLAQRLFGHTDVVHSLAFRHQPISYPFRTGELVCFDWKGYQQQGIISRITKRATVMVPDRRGDYMDCSGIRYQKFYVPLSNLQPCKEQ